MAKLKSLILPRPLDMIIGFLVFATAEINGTSVISGDAILYAGHPIFSNKFKLDMSKTDAKIITLLILQKSKISVYQSNGVSAF